MAEKENPEVVKKVFSEKLPDYVFHKTSWAKYNAVLISTRTQV